MLEPGLDRHEWESRWASLEEDLEDSPRDVLPELDELVDEMLDERGYAIDDPVAARATSATSSPTFSRRGRSPRCWPATPTRLARRRRAAVNNYRAVYEYLLEDRRAVAIVPFEPAHADGFRSLVADTLREFGFEPDPEFDADLDDPETTYTRCGSRSTTHVVGSVRLRDLGDGAVELKRMYLRPDQRGRGLGRQLLGVALDWARDHGMRPSGSTRASGWSQLSAVRGLRFRARAGRRAPPGPVPPAVRAAPASAARRRARARRRCRPARSRRRALLDEVDVRARPRPAGRR
jgi:GNAT superfamily N-acetyltransferase